MGGGQDGRDERDKKVCYHPAIDSLLQRLLPRLVVALVVAITSYLLLHQAGQLC